MYDNIRQSEGQWWPPVETNRSRYEVREYESPVSIPNLLFGIWDTKEFKWVCPFGKYPFSSYLYESVSLICSIWNQNYQEN